MKPRKTWVLVADGARARVLENCGFGTGLKPALNFEFAKSRAPSRKADADKPGRGQVPGNGAHHAKPHKSDWHTFEKHVFATELAQALEDALNQKAFDDLVLVAPPKTLGDLRRALDARVAERVSGEVGKDLTHLTPREMEDHLDKVVRL